LIGSDAFRDRELVTDASGAFVLRFDPPRDLQLRLVAKLEKHAQVSWSWDQTAPGEVRDLGDTTLLRGATVTGRIVGADGRCPPGDWLVSGHGMATPLAEGSEATIVSAAPDAETHQFRLVDLPPGHVWLTATCSLGAKAAGPIVELHPGDAQEVDISYTEIDLRRRIAVEVVVEPIDTFYDEVSEIVLSGPAIGVRRIKPRMGTTPSFDDLPPGRYAVEVNDARCQPWRREGVEPGTAVSAHLVGPAQLRLSAVDADTSAPIPAFRASTLVRAARFQPAVFPLWRGEEPPERGLVDHVLATNEMLIVQADGYAECRVPLVGLGAGEVRSLEVRLARGATVSGVVLESDGVTPAARTLVALAASLQADELAGDFAVVEAPPLETRTDDDGWFAFPCVRRGSYALAAGPRAAQIARSLDIAGADVDVELILPPSGSLGGRLIAPEATRFADWRVGLLPLDFGGENSRQRWLGETALARDGTFRFDRVPAGTARVVLVLPDVISVWGFRPMRGLRGATIPLGEAVVQPGEATCQDFDLGSRLPGSAHITVQIDGAPAAGAMVQLFTAGVGLTGAAILDEQGTAHIRSLPPGLCQFQVGSIDQSWFLASQVLGAVASGREMEVAIASELISGTLLIVDAATGKPLPKQCLRFNAAGWTDGGFFAHSNDQGEVHLCLAPGSYQIMPGRSAHQVLGREAPTGSGGWVWDVDAERQRERDISTFTWSARGSPPVALRLK
jgi:hypothetical protein